MQMLYSRSQLRLLTVGSRSVKFSSLKTTMNSPQNKLTLAAQNCTRKEGKMEIFLNYARHTENISEPQLVLWERDDGEPKINIFLENISLGRSCKTL
jgi:hypothetical protein